MERLVSSVLFLLLATTAASAAEFRHPASLWKIAAPEGWQVELVPDDPTVDLRVVFGADTKAGVWVWTLPLPDDEFVEAPALRTVVAGLLGREEVELQPANSEVNLGGLKAVSFTVKRTRGQAKWRGQAWAAARDGAVLVVFAGAVETEWDARSRQLLEIAGSFDGTLRTILLGEPPPPKERQQANTVVEKYTAAVPMIRILASNLADGSTVVLGSGTGFVVHPDGWVVTNRHVVEAQSIEAPGLQLVRQSYDPVKLTWDETTKQEAVLADVIAVGMHSDLALLKIRGDRKWVAMPVGDMARVRSADRVVVMGWPDPKQFGDTTINQNEGSLTNIARDPTGRPYNLRHSARTTGGNSGGPVYDLDVGGVIGAHYAGLINTSKGFADVFYHGVVPSHRMAGEFPQLLTNVGAPTSAADRAALLELYFRQERFGAVMLECRRALEADARDGVAHAYRFAVLSWEGDAKRADESLTAALKTPAGMIAVARLAGRRALQTGQWAEAVEWAGKLKPEDPESHVLRGRAEFALGKFAAAEASFERATKLAGGRDADAHVLLGITRVQKWLTESRVAKLPAGVDLPRPTAALARASLEAGLELRPWRNRAAHAYLGLLALLAGNGEAAQAHRKAAADAGVDSITLRHNFGGHDLRERFAVAYFDLLIGDSESALKTALPSLSRPTGQGAFLAGWARVQLAATELQRGDKTAAAESAQAGTLLLSLALKMGPNEYWADDAKRLLAALGAGSESPAAPLLGAWGTAIPREDGKRNLMIMIFNPDGSMAIVVRDPDDTVLSSEIGTLQLAGEKLTSRDSAGNIEDATVSFPAADRLLLTLKSGDALTFIKLKR